MKCNWLISFPLISINDILEREYFLIVNLHLSYSDIENMPLEYMEWFYRKYQDELLQMQAEEDM